MCFNSLVCRLVRENIINIIKVQNYITQFIEEFGTFQTFDCIIKYV